MGRAAGRQECGRSTFHLAGVSVSHHAKHAESQREYTPLHRPLFCPFCRKYSVFRALFPAHNAGSSGISHGVLNLIFIKESFYIT